MQGGKERLSANKQTWASVAHCDGQKTTVTHYRDGEMIGTATRDEGFHSGAYDLRLGTYGGMHWLYGAIDEVKMWDRALAEEAVREEMRLGSAP